MRLVYELREDPRDNRDLSQMVDKEKWWAMGKKYKDLPESFIF